MLPVEKEGGGARTRAAPSAPLSRSTARLARRLSRYVIVGERGGGWLRGRRQQTIERLGGASWEEGVRRGTCAGKNDNACDFHEGVCSEREIHLNATLGSGGVVCAFFSSVL